MKKSITWISTSFSIALQCISPGRAMAKLSWSATDGNGAGLIVSANDEGSNVTNIVSGATNVKGPNGLEYGNGQLWWPDQQLNAVKHVNPDGSGPGSFTSAQNPYARCCHAQFSNGARKNLPCAIRGRLHQLDRDYELCQWRIICLDHQSDSAWK